MAPEATARLSRLAGPSMRRGRGLQRPCRTIDRIGQHRQGSNVLRSPTHQSFFRGLVSETSSLGIPQGRFVGLMARRKSQSGLISERTEKNQTV